MSSILSISLRDAAAKAGSLPIYFDDAATVAQIQDYATGFLPHLDAAIDARILRATVTLNLTLPGGLKTAAVDDNRVREGVNLTYSESGVIYVQTYYVPSWSNAGFDGDAVLQSGVYDNVIQDLFHAVPAITGIQPTDEYGNVNTAFIDGKRAFRK